ncbi:MAG: chlorite dismutase family protein [Elusimicrobia bacterium]|nr:chlorite dismutase family protein [Elusimicrobiota bacterium]
MSHPPQAPASEAPDLREKGGPVDGVPQALDRRLFLQLTAFTGARDSQALAEALAASGLECVLYEEANDPAGVAVLAMGEDPGPLLARLRAVLAAAPFAGLTLKPEFSLLGRTYALGYEPRLEDWLLRRPRRVTRDPDRPWAIWYPLRRTGAFAALPRPEQQQILKEHGGIGRRFGDADLALDVRLACHGLDKNDNDFVIGLIGRELHPLSALVEAMRPTVQTSRYLAGLGPFFVGRAVWQAPLGA